MRQPPTLLCCLAIFTRVIGEDCAHGAYPSDTINMITRYPQWSPWIEEGNIVLDEVSWTTATSVISFQSAVIFMSIPQVDDGEAPVIARLDNVVSSGQVSFAARLYSTNNTYCLTWHTPSSISRTLSWLVVEQGAYNVSGDVFFVSQGPITRQNSDSTNQNNFVTFPYPAGCVSQFESCAYEANIAIGTIAQLQTLVYPRMLIPRGVSIRRRFAKFVLQPNDSLDQRQYIMTSPETLAYMTFPIGSNVLCTEKLSIASYKFIPQGVDVMLISHSFTYASAPGVFGIVGTSTSLADSTGLRTLYSNTTHVAIRTQEDCCYDDEDVHTTPETVFVLVIGRAVDTDTCTVCRGYASPDEDEIEQYPPVAYPSFSPVVPPTMQPTMNMTLRPTYEAGSPTPQPTIIHTNTPTATPFDSVTSSPTSTLSTSSPTRTAVPTSTPSPTECPSVSETVFPTVTSQPTSTALPTHLPTLTESSSATFTPVPTHSPSIQVSMLPTATPAPTTAEVSTQSPTAIATEEVTVTQSPTSLPSITLVPTTTPAPTRSPSAALTPSQYMTSVPSSAPSTSVPTVTTAPTATVAPTSSPSESPSLLPTAVPTLAPTATPTAAPTSTPSSIPSLTPTSTPSGIPSLTPTSSPSASPSEATHYPTIEPGLSTYDALCRFVASTNLADISLAGGVSGWSCPEGVYLSNEELCSQGWTGLQCNAQHAVTSLRLSNIGITGFVSSSIGALVSLESLDLSGNELMGPLPYSLSQLSFLSQLRLGGNKLGIRYNRRLSASRNLDGATKLPFPDALSVLSQLTYLNIASNSFSGEISSDYCYGTPMLTTLILNPTGTSGVNDNEITCIASCLLNNPDLVIIGGDSAVCATGAPTSAPTTSSNQLLQKVKQKLANASLTIITVFVVFGAFTTGAVVYWIRTRNDRRRAAAENGGEYNRHAASSFLRGMARKKQHLLLDNSESSLSSLSASSQPSNDSQQQMMSEAGALTWDRMFHVNVANNSSAHSDSSRGLQMVENRVNETHTMSVLQPTDDAFFDTSSDSNQV